MRKVGFEPTLVRTADLQVGLPKHSAITTRPFPLDSADIEQNPNVDIWSSSLPVRVGPARGNKSRTYLACNNRLPLSPLSYVFRYSELLSSALSFENSASSELSPFA